MPSCCSMYLEDYPRGYHYVQSTAFHAILIDALTGIRMPYFHIQNNVH